MSATNNQLDGVMPGLADGAGVGVMGAGAGTGAARMVGTARAGFQWLCRAEATGMLLAELHVMLKKPCRHLACRV
jgi:hypothetical protein